MLESGARAAPRGSRLLWPLPTVDRTAPSWRAGLLSWWRRTYELARSATRFKPANSLLEFAAARFVTNAHHFLADRHGSWAVARRRRKRRRKRRVRAGGCSGCQWPSLSSLWGIGYRCTIGAAIAGGSHVIPACGCCSSYSSGITLSSITVPTGAPWNGAATSHVGFVATKSAASTSFALILSASAIPPRSAWASGPGRSDP
jgi:hypothetical protein